MGGRPRTSTAELEARGSFEAHPERRAERANEPVPDGPVGLPPRYFDKMHRRVWREFVQESPRGVLTIADRKQLELAVRLTCRMRVVPGRMNRALNFLGKALETLGMDPQQVVDFKEDMRKTLGCSAQELSLLSQCLRSMGLTPSDRSKVIVVEPELKPLAKSVISLRALLANSRPYHALSSYSGRAVKYAEEVINRVGAGWQVGPASQRSAFS